MRLAQAQKIPCLTTVGERQTNRLLMTSSNCTYVRLVNHIPNVLCHCHCLENNYQDSRRLSQGPQWCQQVKAKLHNDV